MSGVGRILPHATRLQRANPETFACSDGGPSLTPQVHPRSQSLGATTRRRVMRDDLDHERERDGARDKRCQRKPEQSDAQHGQQVNATGEARLHVLDVDLTTKVLKKEDRQLPSAKFEHYREQRN